MNSDDDEAFGKEFDHKKSDEKWWLKEDKEKEKEKKREEKQNFKKKGKDVLDEPE